MKTLFTILLSVIFLIPVVNGNNDDPIKKEKHAHVKIIKDVDGEEVLVDTVFTNENSNEIKEFLSKMDIDMDIELDDETGETMVKVITKADGKGTETSVIELLDFDVDTELLADSTLKKIIVTAEAKGDKLRSKKVFITSKTDGETVVENECVKIITTEIDEKPHVQFLKHKSSSLIDLNDENIISIKRKTLKDGNEKIEIVRKKK